MLDNKYIHNLCTHTLCKMLKNREHDKQNTEVLG